MKRAKVKTIDFATRLRECILFNDTEVDAIVEVCRKDKTVSGILTACQILDIGLRKEEIFHLCQAGFNL